MKKTIFRILLALLILVVILVGYVFIMMSQMKPLQTGMINEHLYAGKTGFVNFFIWQEDGQTIAFDSGHKPQAVKKALQELDIDPDSVSYVFLTHSDGDHAGGVRAFQNARVYLFEKEQAVLDGTKPRKFFYMEGSNEIPVKEYGLLKENEIMQLGNTKIETISTPGHTPGSASFLVNDSILIVGDAAQITGSGELKPIFRPINNDYDLARKTLDKIESVGARMIVTAHDGYIRK